MIHKSLSILNSYLSKISRRRDTKWSEYGHRFTVDSGIPLNISGEPLPWYTYPAIEFINSLDISSCTVFEYGSGVGTRYWSKRVKKIVSVENNKEWYQKTKGEKIRNLELIFEDKIEEYPKTITKYGRFDIIVIDGINRIECSKLAISHLRSGGIIILDNSDWYKKATKYLAKKSSMQVDYMGIGPVNNYMWSTSVFYFNNKNNIPRKRVLPKPIGGVIATDN